MKRVLYFLLSLALVGCSKYQGSIRLRAPYDGIVGCTGSMEPTLHCGDRIHVDPILIENVKVGDIIVYWEEARQLDICHRVHTIIHAADGKVGLLCWGDANSSADRHIVTSDNLIGIVTHIN